MPWTYRLSVWLVSSCLAGLPLILEVRQTGARPAVSPYLGQPLPALSPQIFAPGIVSTDAIELNSVFAPDLKEFFFARLIAGVQTMHHAELQDGKWSAPRPLLLFPNKTRAVADDMTLTADGRELYFLGNHPHPQDGGVRSADIWRSRRINGQWSTAEVLPAPISTDASEIYPVVVRDGSLYFTSNRPGGRGPTSVYRAQRLAAGSFADPVLVPEPINAESGIGDVFVSPDETYMVFSSSRPPSLGSGDLFVSFRRDGGTWGEPVHLGTTVNTEELEYCPMVSPDGRYLFFSRRRGASWKEATAGDVYWIDVKFLEQFRR
jgi:hypothetical protein